MPICSRFYPIFSSISFTVSSLYFMCRSLIHLELSFVQGEKNGSISIFLHANLQLIQHYLFKMLSFFSLDVFSSFVKYQVSKCVWAYFWVCNTFFPLIVSLFFENLHLSWTSVWCFWHRYFFLLFIFLLVFWYRVLCSPGMPAAHCLAEDDLKILILLAHFASAEVRGV